MHAGALHGESATDPTRDGCATVTRGPASHVNLFHVKCRQVRTKHRLFEPGHHEGSPPSAQIARGLSLAELAEATNMWWVTYAKDIENTQNDTLVRAKSASKAEVEIGSSSHETL